MMDESKESLKKSLSSLVVDDNKFVLGLEALAHFVLGQHGQILPKFNVIDIFTRIENQTEIWKILHMTNTEDMLNALLAVDLSRNFYPTNTQWDYFHDALSSHAWSSKRYLEFDRVYQTIVQDLKEFFHLRSLYLMKLVATPQTMHAKSRKSGNFGEKTATYFIEKIPVLQLTSTGHQNRIRPTTNPQFKGSHGVESIMVTIEGIAEGDVELSTLNTFSQSTLNVKETLSGIPSHFMCRLNQVCYLKRGSPDFSPYTEWRIKLLGHHGSNTAHNVEIQFSLLSDNVSKEIDSKEKITKVHSSENDLLKSNEPSWCNEIRDDVPSSNNTANKVSHKETDTIAKDPGYDDDYNFIRKKYGYHSTIEGLTDILIATDLDQMNTLFETLHDSREGVVTNFTTPMFLYSDEACRVWPGGYSTRTERYIKLVGNLLPPRFYFLRNNEHTVRITWEFDNSSYFEYRNEFIPCDDFSHLNTSVSEHPDSIQHATMEAYIPMKILFGTVEEGENGSGGVILDLQTSAFQPDHLTFACEECKEAIFLAIKDIFIETMTEIFLTTIRYDPAITPPEVRPTKFRFSTVCTDCDGIDGNGGGYGYLIVLVCANTDCLEDLSSFEPSDLGLDQATPTWHSTIIFLNSAVLFKKIIKPAWNDGNEIDFGTVTYVDDQSCIQKANYKLEFLGNVIAKLPENQGTLEIPASDFSLTADMDGLRVFMDYEQHGLESLLRMNDSGCHFSWWDIFTLGILYMIRCGMVEHADKIRSGSIKITADEHNAFTFQPECFSFKFNEIEVVPVVDFQIDNPDGVDRAAMAKTNANVEKAAAAMLTFRAAESKTVSLFAAANIIFPSSKVLNMSNLFITGDAIMMGTLNEDYNPDIDDLDLTNGLPAHCYQ